MKQASKPDITPIISLGGLTPEVFLRDYWQKKPLLIRGAIPDFQGLLTPEALQKLSYQDDAESRLVTRKDGHWKLKHGPFAPRDFSKLHHQNWSLLVQDINHFLPSARNLLSRFRFIPHARLDDLMVSFAPEGGGIGPHFDSYDVFLLQGLGSRRWQISAQRDDEFIPNLPLRILKNFKPEQEWILNAGDMLYLPPHYAHNGIALDDCMTYSIGFRAPSHQELITQFLVYLQDNLKADGRYTDPDLKAQIHPAEISSEMHEQVNTILKKISWNQQNIEDFLGCYLSEPKPHVFFDQPDELLDSATFLHKSEESGIELNLKTRILASTGKIFINGEICKVDPIAYLELINLANNYELAPSDLSSHTRNILYKWYASGYLTLKKNSS